MMSKSLILRRLLETISCLIGFKMTLFSYLVDRINLNILKNTKDGAIFYIINLQFILHIADLPLRKAKTSKSRLILYEN